MSRLDATLSAIVARWLPGGPEETGELVATFTEVIEERGRIGRWRELGSMLALGLRLRTRIATDDDPRRIVAHGASLGASLVLVLSAAWALAASPPVSGTVALATASLLTGGALARSVVTRVALPLAAVAVWLGPAAGARLPIAAGVGVGVAFAVLGSRAARPAPRMVPAAAVVAVLASDPAIGATIGHGWLSEPFVVAAAALGPAILLAVGWFDPRLAVAATTVWFWRLAATDLDLLVTEVGELGHGLTVDAFVVRWAAMATGVAAGCVVSRLALLRAATV